MYRPAKFAAGSSQRDKPPRGGGYAPDCRSAMALHKRARAEMSLPVWTKRECAPTPKAGFCSLGTIRNGCTKDLPSFPRSNGGAPNRGAELRGSRAHDRRRMSRTPANTVVPTGPGQVGAGPSTGR
jgi:hypothetical protein